MISAGHTCVRLRDVPWVKSDILQGPHFLLSRSGVFTGSFVEIIQRHQLESRPIVPSHLQLLLAPGCQRKPSKHNWTQSTANECFVDIYIYYV